MGNRLENGQSKDQNRARWSSIFRTVTEWTPFAAGIVGSVFVVAKTNSIDWGPRVIGAGFAATLGLKKLNQLEDFEQERQKRIAEYRAKGLMIDKDGRPIMTEEEKGRAARYMREHGISFAHHSDLLPYIPTRITTRRKLSERIPPKQGKINRMERNGRFR